LLYLPILAGFAAIVLAWRLFDRMLNIKVENEKMKKISDYIYKGTMAYLYRQYKGLSLFVVIMFFLLLFVPGLGIRVSVCYIAGSLLSVMAGYFGMKAATKANVRTAQAAMIGQKEALNTAFSGGAIMGLLVIGLGSIGITSLYIIFKDTTILIGFALGASSIALFCRVGGGIFTKAADVGADLVGKVEKGIPEDDPFLYKYYPPFIKASLIIFMDSTASPLLITFIILSLP